LFSGRGGGLRWKQRGGKAKKNEKNSSVHEKNTFSLAGYADSVAWPPDRAGAHPVGQL
jgi:hypothetical protein